MRAVASYKRSGIWMTITLAAIAAVVWTLAVHRITSGHDEVARTNSILITSNRDTLRICVQSYHPQVTNEQLRSTVGKALNLVQTHPDFERSGLGAQAPVVDIGCPGPARAGMPGFDWEDGMAPESSALVETPSNYRTFVFVVSSERLLLPNGTTFWRTPQELYCYEGRCGEVTTALYLTPEELDMVDLVSLRLADTLGLWVDWHTMQMQSTADKEVTR